MIQWSICDCFGGMWLVRVSLSGYFSVAVIDDDLRFVHGSYTVKTRIYVGVL